MNINCFIELFHRRQSTNYPGLTKNNFPGPKCSSGDEVDVVGDNNSTGSPEPDQDFTPTSTKSPCPRSLLKLSDLTPKQAGYRLSSNGFRSGGTSEPVSVLLNSSSYPTSELLHTKPEQRNNAANNRHFPTRTSVLDNSYVPGPYTVTMATSCRSPEMGSKPLTPPVTPMSTGSPVTMATSSPVTPLTGTQRDKLFHTPTPKSFSIADLLAPESRPRISGDSKPTLQLQTSPKQASPGGAEQERPTPELLPTNRLMNSPVPCQDNSVRTTTPTDQMKLEHLHRSAGGKHQRQALDMQYEQTNRNINYLRSFLLAQRLNTL